MEETCRLRARQLLEELGVVDPPVDVEGVASKCGLEVVYVNKGTGFYGQLLKERRIIEVQKDNHPHRQRFTIAHEIGHHVMGHNPVFCVFDNRGLDDPRKVNEKQAQIFASELLMPEHWVRKYWLELKRDRQALARKFYVSDEAMFRRLADAGLLGLEPAL